jgi:hypothetical protein
MPLACMVAGRCGRRRGLSGCMLLAAIVAGRSCRRRATSACPLHPLVLAGEAAGGASAHAACMHCCLQELPPARHQRKPLASIVAGRSCRQRSTGACRVQGCCWQELPPARHQCMPLASIVDGRSCRRRGLSTCVLHALLLAGAAAGEAPSHAACIHRGWQERPPARPQRISLACIVAGRSCQLRGFGACRLHPSLLAGEAAVCEALSMQPRCSARVWAA